MLCVERPKLQVYACIYAKCIRKPLSFLRDLEMRQKFIWEVIGIANYPQFFESGALIEEYLMLNFKFVGKKKSLVLCFDKFFTLCFLRISSFHFGSSSLGSWRKGQETCLRVGKGGVQSSSWGSAALHSYTLTGLWVAYVFSLGVCFKDCETLLSELIKFVFFEYHFSTFCLNSCCKWILGVYCHFWVFLLKLQNSVDDFIISSSGFFA